MKSYIFKILLITFLEITIFSFSSHPTWRIRNVGFKVNLSNSPSYAGSEILKAMDEWSDVEGSDFEFSYKGATTETQVKYNGVNIIYFTDLPSALGYCYWWYACCPAYTIESDIQIDSNPPSWFQWNKNRLKATVLHELGHALGLNHSIYGSIMYPTLSDNVQTLGADDIFAIQNLYPGTTRSTNFPSLVQNLSDYNNDGKDDLILHDASAGKISLWLLDGVKKYEEISSNTVNYNISTNYEFKTKGDFNGDGNQDFLFRHQSTGEIFIVLLNGVNDYDTLDKATIKESLDSNMKIKSIADFNGDGNDDILFQDKNSGKLEVWLMDGITPYDSIQSGVIINSLDTEWEIQIVSDFNGDSKADILWKKDEKVSNSRQINIWLMNGITQSSSLTTGSIYYTTDNLDILNWKIIGSGDFNNDGKSDILFRHIKTGAINVWLLDGVKDTSLLSKGNIHSGLNLSWDIKSINDFDGDGKADLLFRNSSTGAINVWLMDGITHINFLTSGSIHSGLSLSWKINGVGDFNNDNNFDIIFRNSSTNAINIWLLDGVTPKDQLEVETIHPGTYTNINIENTAQYDVDNLNDILFKDSNSGQLMVYLLDNNEGPLTNGSIHSTLSSSWNIVSSKDFNDDNIDDLLFRNSSTGAINVWLMNGTQDSSLLTKGNIHPNLSNSWVIKHVADFDADGKADLLFRNSSTGAITVWLMNGASSYTTLTKGNIHPNLSNSWVIKHVADFDGDGKADLLFRNSSTGAINVWLMNGASSYTTLTKGNIHPNLSNSWVIKHVADFDGDGKADLLFRNSSTGAINAWLMNGASSYTTLTKGNIHPNLSNSWVIKYVTDFDADGKSDLLFRNSSTGSINVWLMNGANSYTTLDKGGIHSGLSNSWEIKSYKDLNNDNKGDLLFRNSLTGSVNIWYMNGVTSQSDLNTRTVLVSYNSSWVIK